MRVITVYRDYISLLPTNHLSEQALRLPGKIRKSGADSTVPTILVTSGRLLSALGAIFSVLSRAPDGNPKPYTPKPLNS